MDFDGKLNRESGHAGIEDPTRQRFPTPVRWALFVMTTVMITAVVAIFAVSERSSASSADAPVAAVPDATAELMATRLPMEVNAQVDRWIRRFLDRDRASFEGYLVREGLYGAMIRDRLRARGMPEELLYLAMIESGFSPTATSAVSASGVWQFMQATAREYGLTVDYWVDERRDPVQATEAALDYLEVLYDEFDSWYLAAAAYNSGPGRVRRALAAYDGRVAEDEEIYWEISEHLPRETREYVPKMLAATLLAQEAEAFGFEVEKELPYLFDQVLVPAGTPLTQVADALEVPGGLIRELNPHLVRGIAPPDRSYLVRVPQGDSHRLVASLDFIRGE